jgi:hypothetical protein
MRRLDPECYFTEINYPHVSSQRITAATNYMDRAGKDEIDRAKRGRMRASDAVYIIRCGERW